MENKETKYNNNESGTKSPDFSCCGGKSIRDCCESMGRGIDCRYMVGECMKGFRWFPLIPVILGILLLLLGYYLDAGITRILWMAAAGFLILMGTFALLMMSRMTRIWRSAE